jgi:RHH-type transcriptional regulator, rel operon repressor / antitoxin RelB
MTKQTVSFRLDARKVKALDTIAKAVQRDRTFLLGEAVQYYIHLHEWQLKQIQESIAEADAGRLLDHAQVKNIARKWRRR